MCLGCVSYHPHGNITRHHLDRSYGIQTLRFLLRVRSVQAATPLVQHPQRSFRGEKSLSTPFRFVSFHRQVILASALHAVVTRSAELRKPVHLVKRLRFRLVLVISCRPFLTNWLETRRRGSSGTPRTSRRRFPFRILREDWRPTLLWGRFSGCSLSGNTREASLFFSRPFC